MKGIVNEDTINTFRVYLMMMTIERKKILKKKQKKYMLLWLRALYASETYYLMQDAKTVEIDEFLRYKDVLTMNRTLFSYIKIALFP